MLFKEGIGRISTMPIIQSAKKALRQTRRRTVLNKKKLASLSLAKKKLKKSKTAANLAFLYKIADKLVKTGIIHKNKAARIKSQAAKKLPLNPVKAVKKTVVKKA